MSAVQITNITPLTGWRGSIVTITGRNFSPHIDGNTITIGNDSALVLKTSSTEIQVLVGPKATGATPIKVTRTTGSTSSAASSAPFKILPVPDVTDATHQGHPVVFSGPQHGTPKPGVLNQSVVVAFCHGIGDEPDNPDALAAAEMAKFETVNRFWSQATYATQRAANPSGQQGTTWTFRPTPWLRLPLAAVDYTYTNADIHLKWVDLVKKSNRRVIVASDNVRAFVAHSGGGVAVTDLNGAQVGSYTGLAGENWVAHDVTLRGDRLYIAAGTAGIIVLNAAAGAPLTEEARILEVNGQPIGDVIACDAAGDLLAAATVKNLTYIFDISDPATAPVLIGKLVGPMSESYTFVKVVGNKVYTASWGFLVEHIIDRDSRMADLPAFITGFDIAGDFCVAATMGNGLTAIDLAASRARLEIQGTLLDAPPDIFSVELTGTTAIAACGSEGILIADFSDPASPGRMGLAALPADPAERDCFHVTAALPSTPSRCLGSFGSTGLAIVSGPFSGTPAVRGISEVQRLPGLGGENPKAWSLKFDVQWARDQSGKLKADSNIYIDLHEGLIVLLNGVPIGRGTSVVRGTLVPTTEEPNMDLHGDKGLYWLPTPTDWRRLVHEIGHWRTINKSPLPDLYSEILADNTELVGSASAWDMMGDVDLAPLFSGYNAEQWGVYRPANIAPLDWDPATALSSPSNHTFTVVAHGHSEVDVASSAVHLVKISLGGTEIAYYIEVRQKEPRDSAGNLLLFDRHLPIDRDACVLVTRAEEIGSEISNAFERLTSLVAVLNSGQSTVDAGRAIRITAGPRITTGFGDTAAFSVTVSMNEFPPTSEDGKLDLFMAHMKSGSWESEDIWINSTLNDHPDVSYEFTDNLGNIIGNGDRPWVHHRNTIIGRVWNKGSQPWRGGPIQVTAYANAPPGIGDNGNWAPIATLPIDQDIPAGGSETVEFPWTPRLDEHTCLTVAAFPVAGEVQHNNQRAQENVFYFESPGASSHEPVVFGAAVRNPFTVWRRIELRVFGLPDGWHAAVDKRWVWTPPRGEVPVSIVIWTDRDSPRLGGSDKKIDARADVRVEGWTHFGRHMYRPVGGLVAVVKANAKARLQVGATVEDGPQQGRVVRARVRLSPARAGVRGVVEITSNDLSKKTKQHGFATNGRGAAEIVEPLMPGGYVVQAFTSSTDDVAGAESDKLVVRV
ncbi:hypothetical protein B0T14DRAFT_536841 [Immersiella caudata]|uniref:IPT/TIG domain-containing protein n=1 Tax=Immersiella caudata TaxID=314043 RepID=A0AA39WZH2_9PEZI|nr:hypothetical protein B0T14DRAFT_536841 [Immersiella caudata]